MLKINQRMTATIGYLTLKTCTFEKFTNQKGSKELSVFKIGLLVYDIDSNQFIIYHSI